MELKVAASENIILSSPYADENKSQFTLDGTFRFRISENLWIPISFKYDPEHGNVFGFLNVTSNFNWLKL